MMTTYWADGKPLTEAEFQGLQAEKAARRPVEAVDRCLLVKGGGSFCMKQEPLPARWIRWLVGVTWEGSQSHHADDGLFVRVTCEQRSNLAGTRGTVELSVSFDPMTECQQLVYRRQYHGLLPSEPLPMWVGDPLSNLRQHGSDVSKWEV